MLVYGHYDVQPAEPLDLWVSGAFEPSVRGEYIYARGVTDMKGQVLAVFNAIEGILKTSAMPVNLKFLIEGEEEIGSPNLPPFIREHKDLLACDLALNPDSGICQPTSPASFMRCAGWLTSSCACRVPTMTCTRVHSAVWCTTPPTPSAS